MNPSDELVDTFTSGGPGQDPISISDDDSVVSSRSRFPSLQCQSLTKSTFAQKIGKFVISLTFSKEYTMTPRIMHCLRDIHFAWIRSQGNSNRSCSRYSMTAHSKAQTWS